MKQFFVVAIALLWTSRGYGGIDIEAKRTHEIEFCSAITMRNLSSTVERKEKHFGTIKKLVENKSVNMNCFDLFGNTPLSNAAQYGDLEVIELLLKHNATVNKRNKEDNTTPLIHVVYGIYKSQSNMVDWEKKWKPIIVCLLNAGANKNVQDASGNTAITLARNYELHDVARFIETTLCVNDFEKL